MYTDTIQHAQSTTTSQKNLPKAQPTDLAMALEEAKALLYQEQYRGARMALNCADDLTTLKDALEKYADPANWIFDEGGWVWNGPSSLGVKPYELAECALKVLALP